MRTTRSAWSAGGSSPWSASCWPRRLCCVGRARGAGPPPRPRRRLAVDHRRGRAKTDLVEHRSRCRHLGFGAPVTGEGHRPRDRHVAAADRRGRRAGQGTVPVGRPAGRRCSSATPPLFRPLGQARPRGRRTSTVRRWANLAALRLSGRAPRATGPTLRRRSAEEVAEAVGLRATGRLGPAKCWSCRLAGAGRHGHRAARRPGAEPLLTVTPRRGWSSRRCPLRTSRRQDRRCR